MKGNQFAALVTHMSRYYVNEKLSKKYLDSSHLHHFTSDFKSDSRQTMCDLIFIIFNRVENGFKVCRSCGK